jgi:hypothetical protein
MKEIILSDKMIATLNKFVLQRKPDQCWPWLAFKSERGYGRITITSPNGNKVYYAHRVAYVKKYGPFPWKFEVCHSCDKPSCCNPNHLFLGTQLENIRDCINKQRFKMPPQLKGEENGFSKLNQEKVDRIRLLSSLGVYQEDIAKEFNIARAYVGYITKYKVWKS